MTGPRRPEAGPEAPIVQPQPLHAATQQAAVADDHGGQGLWVLRLERQLPWRHRLAVRPWQDGQLTAGLQHSVLHLLQIGDALPPQSLQQFIHRQAVAAHGILQDVAAADDQGRLPAQKRAEADAAETSIAEEHGQRQQRDDGDDAVNQRDAEILHGDGSQIAEKHGQHQLDGLQFSDLTLAGDAKSCNQQEIKNDGAEKCRCHE